MAKKGFTLSELLVVMGLIILLFSISTLSWSNIERESQLDQIASEIKTSIYLAQAKSINNNPSGVYFENNRFVFFFGNSFIEESSSNQETILPNSISLVNINLPNQSIQFDNITGYVSNFTFPENLTLLENHTGKQKIFTINKLGLIEIQ